MRVTHRQGGRFLLPSPDLLPIGFCTETCLLHWGKPHFLGPSSCGKCIIHDQHAMPLPSPTPSLPGQDTLSRKEARCSPLASQSPATPEDRGPTQPRGHRGRARGGHFQLNSCCTSTQPEELPSAPVAVNTYLHHLAELRSPSPPEKAETLLTT